MVNMDTKLDTWKNSLLDMGKRNRLLNYRDTKKSSLRIVKPDLFSLWESFVVKEKPILFPIWKEENKEAKETKTKREADVVTNQPAKELQGVLRNIRSKARTFVEEQGVNTLYLSFGFLRWSEKADDRQQFDAPLLLVPVVLNWESITSPFKLCLHEEEIVLNPTLSYKMEHDFGIKLPEFDMEQEDIQVYFSKIEDLAEENNWKVILETGLGMLSFLKINMYRDLETYRDKVLQHPIVRTIAGDPSALPQDFSEISAFNHDRDTTPEQIFQVVDADSSQQDAIHCAKKGISFVLQGPPGTGKSQTITNIIAECLADGKKILFVSEKMAALDVVYKRLEEANLSDFCLILHSHKANKKEIMEQLETVLNLADKKESLGEETLYQLNYLTNVRKKLNEYAEAIFMVIEPLHKTIYEVNGILASLSGYEEVIFSVPDIRMTTLENYQEYIRSLEHFSEVLRPMCGNFYTNPWRGAIIEYVNNDFRYNVEVNLGELIETCENLLKIYEEISSEFSYHCGDTFEELSKIGQVFDVAEKAYKVPAFWVLKEHTQTLLDEINWQIEQQEDYLDFIHKMVTLQNQIKDLDKEADFYVKDNLFTTSAIDRYESAIHGFIEGKGYYRAWNTQEDMRLVKPIVQDFHDKADEYHVLQKEIEHDFEPEILHIDYHGIYMRFKSEYLSFGKIFKVQYYRDRKKMQGLCRERGKKISDVEIVNILGKLRRQEELENWINEHSGQLQRLLGEAYFAFDTDFDRVKKLMDSWELIKRYREDVKLLRHRAEEIEANEEKMKEYFGFLYQGLETDWEENQKALAWAEAFRKVLGKTVNNHKLFVEKVCGGACNLEHLKSQKQMLAYTLDKAKPQFQWFQNCFKNPEEFCKMEMKELIGRLEKCKSELSALEVWTDYYVGRKYCCSLGLEDYINKIDDGRMQPEKIIPVFKKRFFSLWLDSLLSEFPAVADFRCSIQNKRIQEFQFLDTMQFEIAQLRIRSKLIKNLPSRDFFTKRNTSGNNEIGILKRELKKKRRIMPLRRLFKEIPNLLLRLKPCLMMSPLSVSMFLESDDFIFDTVIFDEASQVCTENAIGAIFRGKQVIIAGDSKQLPPTNFFTATLADNDFDHDENSDDEIDEENSYESVLDEAVLLPERTLLWHYRSRHEHLIAFSNAKIYKNQLITFPSNVEKKEDTGVEYIYVPEGRYDRGGKRGNVIEAAKVADLVFEHFKKFPERSLGVIAFGEVQQQAIDAEVRKRRMENHAFEPFFNEERPAAFFIKSLENVQGDERDTIIFSIGYAKDLQGVMRMQFGPLGLSGGERRLNVAITRGKYNVKLVGSILPGDIDVNRISSEGPKLLRSYIDFAMHGPSVFEREEKIEKTKAMDAQFEQVVCRFLESRGYAIATHVGCSSYQVDIAVKHPALRGQYVIGIECDGASYHSARTARERDRLRRDMLKLMGWELYHIWSVGWIRDPVSEGQHLIDAIEAALSRYNENAVEVLEAKGEEE